jgi:hypothetical protein
MVYSSLFGEKVVMFWQKYWNTYNERTKIDKLSLIASRIDRLIINIFLII